MAAVLILCFSDLWPPFPGGAERLMFNIARHLLRRAQSIHTLTGYEAALPLDGPEVTALDINGWDQVAAVIDELEPDVILTHHHYAMKFETELVATGLPIVQVVLNGRRLAGANLAVYISEWVRETVGGALPQDLVITPPAVRRRGR